MFSRTIASLLTPWVIQRPWRVVGIVMLLVMTAASGARLLQFTADFRYFFLEHDPYRKAYETLQDTYTKPDNILFVLAPGDAAVFSQKGLEAVQTLTREAWQLPYAIRIDSITNFQYTHADGDTLIVGDLIPPDTHFDDTSLSLLRTLALDEPLLRDRLISPTAHVTGINVTLQFPGVSPTTELPATVAAARRLAAMIEADYPDTAVHLTGVAMMNNAFPEASATDNQRLMPLMIALIAFVTFLLLRSWTATAATLLVTFCAIAAAMGMAGYLGITLTSASAASPSIILTLGVANSVHLLVTFFQQLRNSDSRASAMAASLRLNLQPIFLTNATTMIGFLTLNFGDSPPFHDMGNITAMGVGFAFLLSVTLLPAVMMLLPGQATSDRRRAEAWMTQLGGFVVNHRQWLLWSTLAICVVVIAAIPRNELDDQFFEYFDRSTAFRQATDFTVEHLSGSQTIEFSVGSGEPGGISSPVYLQHLSDFAQWLRTQPEVRHVAALTDIMQRLNRNLHNDDPDFHRQPDDRELAAQYLLLYEMSLPYGLDLNDRINVDKSASRVTVTIDTITSRDVLALSARAERWLRENTPAPMHATGAGTAIMSGHMSATNIRSMLVGTTVALVLISMLLVVALRSVRLGLLSLLPNLLPLAMTFGIWGLLVGRVGVAASAISAIALGIVVDDTIHFLSKYQRLRNEDGLTPEEAIKHAFGTVGIALVMTSLILISGFLVLSLSSFEVNHEIGLLTTIALALALLTDFLLLPPVLLKLEEKRNEKSIAIANPA